MLQGRWRQTSYRWAWRRWLCTRRVQSKAVQHTSHRLSSSHMPCSCTMVQHLKGSNHLGPSSRPSWWIRWGRNLTPSHMQNINPHWSTSDPDWVRLEHRKWFNFGSRWLGRSNYRRGKSLPWMSMLRLLGRCQASTWGQVLFTYS